MLNKTVFASRLKGLIDSNDFTSKFVAEQIGVSKQALNQLEKEKAMPSTINLVALADFFDVSTDYLLGRTDDPKIQYSSKYQK